MSESNVNHFGPGVIGQEAYETNKKLEESGAIHFGPGVIGPQPEPAAEAPAAPAADLELLQDAPPAPPAFTSLSIPQLERELKANPAEFDKLYRGEFARPEGCRKGALGVFLSHEQTHQNRPEVVDALIGMLQGKKT